jgi:hypothetical protein
MQPPPRADPGALTWRSPAWVARSPDGRQTADLVSLSQMSRAFRFGMLPPDVEVAIVGEWQWENIRLVLARYASLAPPGGTEREGLPELELTLTVQKDAIAHRTPMQPTLPPAPRFASEFPRRWRASSLREVFDIPLETPLPPRLATLVYGAALVVAAVTWLTAIIAGIASLFSRLNDASDARTVTLAVLVGVGWVLGGVLLAAVIVIAGRAAAGVVLVAQRVDEKLSDERGSR